MGISRSRFLALGLTAFTSLALACGGSDDPTDPGNDDDPNDPGNDDPNDGATVIELTSSARFSPATLTIAAGTTVRWRNTSNLGHTVTPDGHSEWSEWSTNAAGQTFEHVFGTPGVYPYYCEPHRAQGMTGQITVQ